MNGDGTGAASSKEANQSSKESSNKEKEPAEEKGHGEWMTVLRSRRRPLSQAKGKNVVSTGAQLNGNQGGDNAGFQQNRANRLDKDGKSGKVGKSGNQSAVETRSQKSRSNLGGSRYANLEVEDEGEIDEMEGIDGVESTTGVEQSEDQIMGNQPSGSVKESGQRNEERGDGDGPRLAASHAEIMEGITAPTGPGLVAARNEFLASQRLKERTLKEVTNRLEARPVKLKPSWAAPKGSASTTREVGPITGWTKRGDNIRIGEQGSREQSEKQLDAGAASGRPPDPKLHTNQKEDLASTAPNSFGQTVPISREEGGGEELQSKIDETMMDAAMGGVAAGQAAATTGDRC